MGTLTWLHLSDLHTREDSTYDENIVLRALLRDVEARIEQDGLAPDLVVVSGDIAFASRPQEYDIARAFFDDLLATTGLGQDRLFLVPGNHDVDRKAISPLAAGATAILQDRDAVNRFLASDADRALVFQRFHHYREFINRYLGPHLRFDDAGYFYVREIGVAGRKVAVLGLNSAWLAASDEDRGRLLLGERQVRAALDAAAGADLRLALLHHPFDWLHDFDRADAEALLCRDCQFVLHGHMHQVGLLQTRTPDAEAMIIAAGACYETRHYPNAYNLVRLDLTAGVGTVYLRMYSDRQGGFWTKDVLNYRNVPDGVYEFSLPARLREPLAGEQAARTSPAGALRREVPPSSPAAPPGGVTINTGGGALILGDVRVEGGDFVGRDKIQIQTGQPGIPAPARREQGKGVDSNAYDLAAIRSLIRDAFTAADLPRFCHDRPTFRPIVDQFGPGFAFMDMIDAVLTYCEKRVLFPELLAEIRAYNPRQYARYETQIRGSG